MSPDDRRIRRHRLHTNASTDLAHTTCCGRSPIRSSRSVDVTEFASVSDPRAKSCYLSQRRTVSSVVARMEDLVSAGEIDAIAICLLFSYANDVHEQLLGRRLRRALPATPVSISSEVSPVWREYERTSTVLTDAYIKPLMSRYFDDLAAETSRFLDGSPLTILKSNGGTGNVSTVAPKPVTTILSGLAGGVVGGAYFAAAESEPLAITFRHGWHEYGYRARKRWSSGAHKRIRSRVGSAGGHSRRRCAHDRCRWRIDSGGRHRRPSPGRPSQRGSEAGSGMLRAWRIERHGNRCEPSPRPAESALLSRWHGQARTASCIRHARRACSAVASLDRRGCHRGGGRRRREHGERHSPRHDRARCRPSGLRPYSVSGVPGPFMRAE